MNRKPSKRPVIYLRVNRSLHKRIADTAKAEKRSINDYLTEVLERLHPLDLEQRPYVDCELARIEGERCEKSLLAD